MIEGVVEAALWRPVDPARAMVSGHGNALLAGLPATEERAVFEHMEVARVEAGSVLLEPVQGIGHVHLPTTSVVSLLMCVDRGRFVETATVGREGFVGLGAFLADAHEGSGRVQVQMGGGLLRLDLDRWCRVATPGTQLESRLRRYAAARLFQVAQNVACSAGHRVVERLARWLLQTADRSGSTEVQLTHGFLAEILCVRRASVTEALSQLRDEGAIQTERGGIELLDRRRLKRAACTCYELVRARHESLVQAA